MVRLALVSDGFEVETAGDGIEGLDCMQQRMFDVVVVDLQMPRMDGRTFHRELRARGYRTPVVILSAYGAEAAGEELGAEAAVSKPFDPDALTAAVRRLLRSA